MRTIEAEEAAGEALVAGDLARWSGRRILIKLGGAAMADPGAAEGIARDLVRLQAAGAEVALVHGGGASVSAVGRRLGLAPRFVDGLRATDEETMRVAQMVQIGGISRDLIAAIGRAGGAAVGLSGHDFRGWLRATVRRHVCRSTGAPVDLGRVGDVSRVDTAPLFALMAAGWIPVIAPVAVDDQMGSLNVNADSVAAAVGGALGVDRLVLLSDVAGVRGPDGQTRAALAADQLVDWIEEGVVAGGMIPKAGACLDALAAGVGGVCVADGRQVGAALAALAGGGTCVTRGGAR